MDITIAVPHYDGKIFATTARSLIGDFAELFRRGDAVRIRDLQGTCIHIARARLMHNFAFEGESDVLVYVDSDVGWPKGQLVDLVDTIQGHKTELVGGIYPKKTDPVEWPVSFIQDRQELRADPDNGLLEISAVPAGFLAISRRGVERILLHYASDAYEHLGQKTPGVFDPIRVGDKMLQEDYAFCHRWREIGGQVWTNPEWKFTHSGNKVWGGCLGDWLRNRPNGKPET